MSLQIVPRRAAESGTGPVGEGAQQSPPFSADPHPGQAGGEEQMQGGQDGNSERTHKARHRWPCITKPSAPSSSHHIYAACIGNQIIASTKLQISDPPQKKNT